MREGSSRDKESDKAKDMYYLVTWLFQLPRALSCKLLPKPCPNNTKKVHDTSAGKNAGESKMGMVVHGPVTAPTDAANITQSNDSCEKKRI